MVKFIHTADWQLGMCRHFLDQDSQARYTQDQFEAIRSICDLVENEDADFVVVCGDVFENNFVERRTILNALEALRGSSAPFYFLPGNHDPLDSSSVFTNPYFVKHKPDIVNVLSSNAPVNIIDEVELIPAPWTSKSPYCDLVGQCCSQIREPGIIRVVVGHGAVDALSMGTPNPSLIQLGPLQHLIENGLVHYVALGDRHSTTEVCPRVWYSGSHLSTDYDEIDSGNALIVELDGEDCRVEKKKIGAWAFVERSFTLASDSGVDQIEQYLDSVATKDRTILKLGIRGVVSIDGKSRLENVLESHKDLFAAIEEWKQETDVCIEPSDEDLRNLNLSGFAKNTLDQLVDISNAGGSQAETAREAISLLYRLTRGIDA